MCNDPHEDRAFGVHRAFYETTPDSVEEVLARWAGMTTQRGKVSTHKRENSSGNVTGQIALPAMVGSKVRHVLFMT